MSCPMSQHSTRYTVMIKMPEHFNINGNYRQVRPINMSHKLQFRENNYRRPAGKKSDVYC